MQRCCLLYLHLDVRAWMGSPCKLFWKLLELLLCFPWARQFEALVAGDLGLNLLSYFNSLNRSSLSCVTLRSTPTIWEQPTPTPTITSRPGPGESPLQPLTLPFIDDEASLLLLFLTLLAQDLPCQYSDCPTCTSQKIRRLFPC